ncbi:MAG: hypothetical protein JWO67_2548 [Streptosporangiaceae bacterium]|nr:hypothetical protein [Streptosporangiaceae bacterium]
MRDALDSGDQESYFGLLAETELIVPVAPDLVEDVLANRAQLTWPALELDGRTHVQAFTSAAAMRACIGSGVQHFMRLKLGDIAGAWPQPHWWLAVDAGLPIQSLLPSWFVKQIADGDARPPQAGSAVTAMADRGGVPLRSRAPVAEPVRPEVPAADAVPADVPEVAEDLEPPTPDDLPHQPDAPMAAAPTYAAPPDGHSGQSDTFRPAGDVERELLRAGVEGDEDAYVRALLGADVLILVPEHTDPTRRPGRPGFPWQTTDGDGEISIAVFTSPDRMLEVLGEVPGPGSAGSTDFMKFPFASIIRYWPDPAWTLHVNAGTRVGASLSGERLLSLAQWSDQMAAQRTAEHFEPQNEVEKRLFDAAVHRDGDAFFTVLRGAQVLMPADPETPWGIQPGDPGFPWRPVPVQGQNAIQMFTSLKWMHEAIGPSRYIMPGFDEITAAWPDAGWALVLNPGAPIDATVPGDQVPALRPAPPDEPPAQEPGALPPQAEVPAEPAPEAGPPLTAADSLASTDPVPDTEPAPGAEPVPQAEPGAAVDPPAGDLGTAAAPIGATDPVTGTETAAAGPDALPEFEPGNRSDQELYEAAVTGDTDAFLRVLMRTNVLIPIPDGAPVEITPVDPEFRWDAALRDPSSVRVFTSLLQLRRAAESSDPERAGQDQPFVYTDFRDLIGSWPHADWAMLVNPGTRIGASLRGDQVQALSDWALRVGLSRRVDPTSAFTDAPLSEVPAAQAYRPEPGPAPAYQPPVLQKVLPHGHVPWYLDQGYDRIGGFVHLAADVNDLQTPQQLYDVLGLSYPDSPFSPDDEGVYVVRWTAHSHDLYRIPFGGRTDEERAGWEEAGWVVEQPPFQGDGFAPGSCGTIREYKVDSVRLPYGAEMYYLGRDRSERFVAVYDPDVLAWLRPEDETGAERAEETEAAR